jgi:hypothetical protein
MDRVVRGERRVIIPDADRTAAPSAAAGQECGESLALMGFAAARLI